jgi:hypothetical protein
VTPEPVTGKFSQLRRAEARLFIKKGSSVSTPKAHRSIPKEHIPCQATATLPRLGTGSPPPRTVLGSSVSEPWCWYTGFVSPPSVSCPVKLG